MKTPDEILKGLSLHCEYLWDKPCAGNCPYEGADGSAGNCLDELMSDTLEYIRQLQDKNRALETELFVNRGTPQPEAPDLTEDEKELIRAYAGNAMKTTLAAKELYFHPNTLAYRLTKVRNKTGLDPRRFRDLVRLMGGWLPEGE